MLGALLGVAACGTTQPRTPQPEPPAVVPAGDVPLTTVPAPRAAAAPTAKPLPALEASPAPRRLRLAAVGDIMLDGSARPYLERAGYGHAFAALAPLLLGADLAIANLEGPLTGHEEPLLEKAFLFRSPPRPVAAALAGAGIDAVSLANNHILDFGLQGLAETVDALAEAGVEGFGAGASLAAARAPVIFQRAGYRVGLLGYSNTFPQEFWADSERGGTAFGHERHVREDVARLAQDVDLVIVSFHWGREGTAELRPYQPLLARAAIDAGAAVVIGHHPHVLQAVERYRDGVIFYSLGNFAFGSFSKRARVSAVAKVEFVERRIHSVTLVPINVDNFEVYFQPRMLDDTPARRVFAELRQLSRERDTELTWRDGAIISVGDELAQTGAE